MLHVWCRAINHLEKWAHKLSDSRQIIKPQGQPAGFHAWHHKYLSMAIHLWPWSKRTEICCLLLLFSVVHFAGVKLRILPPLLPHYCLILPSPFCFCFMFKTSTLSSCAHLTLWVCTEDSFCSRSRRATLMLADNVTCASAKCNHIN